MTTELNHTIVPATDKHASAAFLAGILGLAVGAETGPFVPVRLGNAVTLDYLDAPAERIVSQHYAFLMSDAEFDAAFARVQDLGLDYWADPMHDQPGRINHSYGGRGVYLADPDGHNLELMTH